MGASEDKANRAGIDSDTVRRPLRDGIDTVRSTLDDVAYSAQGATHTAIDRARDGLDHVRDRVGEVLTTGKDKAADVLAASRETVMGAYASGREKASEAYQTAYERAKSAGGAAADGIDTNPIVALAGGIALGVVIGALLPRSQREHQLYGAIGDRLGDLAREAAGSAREAGQAKLIDMGVSQDRGRDLVKTLVDAAIQAALAAGSAALESGRAKRAADKG